MKVTLDLSKLLQDGAITPAEHDRLARLGRHDTSLLLVNVLIGFGVIAVAAGGVAMVPDPVTGVVIGAVAMALGIGLVLSRRPAWTVLANIFILVGALMLGVGIVLVSQGVVLLGSYGRLMHGPFMSFWAALLLVAALFAGSAALARSSLLAVMAVLVLFVALGSGGAYEHAFYEIEVRQPLATVLAFSVLALAAHMTSRAVPGEWERLATAVARTAVFLVNMGFWVGSLWGDDLDWLREPHDAKVSAGWFAVAWAVALLAAAVWAGQANRRWVLNVVTVFAGIHFYTQWFEYLGATPATVLAAGALVLVFALILWRLNRRPAVPKPLPA